MPKSAFLPPVALPKHTTSRNSHHRSSHHRSSRRPPTAQIQTVSDDQLTALASTSPIVVLKCFAPYCAGCRGVEPKFRKIAAAYEKIPGNQATFVQIDYARYEAFCRTRLGVESLPFFGIWTDGEYVGGEAMGWQSVANKLCRKINDVLESRRD
eukprot:GFKZ01005719.1.p2 GENE.GFKZ01005719.1~~GFKZ01005719.1.p2  ORF type:complete len:154 (-),score=25.68 GFKZ01005719.1:746-1207(-)